MEAVLKRKIGTSFYPTPKQEKQQEEVLTYEILQQHKREQQRLIAAGIIEKPKITDDIFTPEKQAEFDKGIRIQEYAALRGIKI